MLFYFHGGDLPSWLTDLIFLFFYLAPVIVPAIVIGVPFLFIHYYSGRNENKSIDDKNS
jgi:ABC-type spermidine/putrescine transport system permease subunit II